MELETSASGRQLLLVTERFHSGWSVKADGARRDIVRVYGDFLGCVVEPGTHRVTFAFAPDSARQGLRLSLAGLSLAVVPDGTDRIRAFEPSQTACERLCERLNTRIRQQICRGSRPSRTF